MYLIPVSPVYRAGDPIVRSAIDRFQLIAFPPTTVCARGVETLIRDLIGDLSITGLERY